MPPVFAVQQTAVPVLICSPYGQSLTVKNKDGTAVYKYRGAQGATYPHIMVPYTFHDPTHFSYPIAKMQPTKPPGFPNNVFGFVTSCAEKTVSAMGACTQAVGQIAALATPASWSKDHFERLEERRRFPVVAIAWHPYFRVFAVAHRQDSVHVYDLVAEDWTPTVPKGLLHEFQKNVTCIEWRPAAAATIAVGCEIGVAIWRIIQDPRPTKSTSNHVPDASHPSHAWVDFLRYPGLSHVSALAWSLDGMYLAVASGTSDLLVVWDFATEVAVPLNAPSRRTTVLKWSPDGRYLIQTTANVFFFTLEGYPKIFAKQMKAGSLETRPIMPTLVEARQVPITGEGHVTVGGPVKQMEMDPSGERLAVTFEPQGEGSELVALFRIAYTPLPVLHLIGLIRGPSWHPTTENVPPTQPLPGVMRFAAHHARGALLAICWQNGKVGFVPCDYKGVAPGLI
ncbi:hypothetical protein BDK51DRAFT_27788 [Blyttiomyces helicus]|uniref:WD40-repeat-containing domain protein n=1 Tax=Blyttiomyces helicus TaxID=388810 RepID=A0A4P9WKR2_9FUNG|nr:hypothetical protein BDK51DRAFT_27788 [Blyttiomyces helicus]|eukprot:RKO92168.1 hypothetical protein BDK51DRAFT_27788 [Blyttiomyces helicus]